MEFTRRLDESNDDEIVTSTDSDIIRETLRIWGSLYIVCFLLYCFLRRRYPRLYNIRSWVAEHESELAKRDYGNGFFSWFFQAFKVTEEEIFEHCGMDALCYVRAMKFGRKLGMMGTFNALWLIPLYATAPESGETEYLSDPLVIITTANIPSSSRRFIGTVTAAYMMFFFTMYLLLQEIKWYTKWRHRFLSRRVARNYAIYVSGIPKAYRSSFKLQTYFENCSSKDAVLEAHVAMDIPNLEAKQARREQVVAKLEHAVALEHKTGDTGMHHRFAGKRGVEKVESVKFFEDELDRLNREIPHAINEISAKNDQFRSKLVKSDANLAECSGLDISALEEEEVFSEEELADMEAISPSKHDDERRPLTADDHFYSDTLPTLREVPSSDSRSETTAPSPDGKDLLSALAFLPEESTPFSSAPQSLDGESEVKSSLQSLDGDSEFKSAPQSEELDREDEEAPVPQSRPTDKSNSNLSASSVFKSVAAGADRAGTSITSGARQAGHKLAKGGMLVGDTIKRTMDVEKMKDESAKIGKKAGAVGMQIVTTAGAVVPILLVKTEGSHRNAGFVVFRDLYSAQTALQIVHHPSPYTMDVMEAPNPGDIYWPNVGLPMRSQRTGKVASFTATAVLCFFWSIPMTFVASLTELNSLRESMPKLGDWIDDHPNAEPILAQVAPLLLLLFNEAILPEILRVISKWEGLISSARVDASMFAKLGIFIVRVNREESCSVGIVLTIHRSFKLSSSLQFLEESWLSLPISWTIPRI